jgi:hypothetical protein
MRVSLSPLKNSCLWLAVLALWTVSASAHPHFSKEITFGWDAVDKANSKHITLHHITVPYNEIKVNERPVGQSWHCGFAKFQTTHDLVNGGNKIAAGEYGIEVTRKENDLWKLSLVTGKDKDKKEIALDDQFEKGLPVEEHLRFDIRPEGPKDKTRVWVVLRFGSFGMKFQVAPAEEAAKK